MIVLRVLLFLAGMAVVARTVLSAVLTFVLPRGVTDRLTRFVFIRMRSIFRLRTRFTTSYVDLDRIWSLFAPVSLLTLPVVWLLLVLIGYAAMSFLPGGRGHHQAAHHQWLLAIHAWFRSRQTDAERRRSPFPRQPSALA